MVLKLKSLALDMEGKFVSKVCLCLISLLCVFEQALFIRLIEFAECNCSGSVKSSDMAYTPLARLRRPIANPHAAREMKKDAASHQIFAFATYRLQIY